ncbi:MAG: ABC transporter ATP-binding protein [Candidatus Bathyarchaeia archaeon]
MIDQLLSVRNLHTNFYTYDGVVHAVDNVSFDIEKRESMALVGETGCGKSVTAYSILRLIQPPGKIDKGEVIFEGENLLDKSEAEMRRIRGAKISMIFQEPMAALNPTFTVGEQLELVLIQHQKVSQEDAASQTVECFRKVRIPDPQKIISQYPHQLSGGMAQRVLIAMALSLKPDLLICDEPTTYLDATVQAEILRLIKELQQNLGASMLMITHNLGVVAHTCDTVAVMYAGQIVEVAGVRTLFKKPMHPYTIALINAIPKARKQDGKLTPIFGSVPNLIDPPSGCRFHPRCPIARPECSQKEPGLEEIEPNHQVKCFAMKWDQPNVSDDT